VACESLTVTSERDGLQVLFVGRYP